MSVYDEIRVERDYQDKVWGHSFDDKNTFNDWVAYICAYASKHGIGIETPDSAKRIALLKTAALAVAAIETMDRNNGTFPKRHFDK